MNEKALSTLEYDKIIEMLTSYASSSLGKQRCENLLPSTSIGEIEHQQQQTSDALTRLFQKGTISFGSVKDVRASLKRLEIGSSLNIIELLQISSLLENTSRVKTYGRKERESISDDSLTILFDSLEPLPLLSTEIRRCIVSEEEIADDASAALKQIRRSMKVTGDRIHTQLAGMLTGSSRSYLQDAVITMRNGRYCIPVKAEYKNQVPGMIHDQSSTGSTLFIEPMAVVKLNNDIRDLELKEAAEIEVILASLIELAAQQKDAIQYNLENLVELDFIFARARLAMEQNATRPIFNTNGYINIRKGRHPLIPKKQVVPIDIHLGKEFHLLVVTGPNTGGKTVSLKTVGLLTLMGQSGLHIPALDRSELSVFEEVYADIGDEQSIEQSLSTFSSHMTNVVSFIEKADRHSLVLFDELGAGTDPTEGAALAIAILNHLQKQGIRTMATTHYSELKVYALSTPGVENASCEFNVETLRPTYRLLIGIPGKSNAFAISGKLGLPSYIIDEAKKQINENDESFEVAFGNRSDLSILRNGGNAFIAGSIDDFVCGILRECLHMQQELLAFRTQLRNTGTAHGHLLAGNGRLGIPGILRLLNRSGSGNRLLNTLVGQEITNEHKSGSSQQGHDQHSQKNDHKGVVAGHFFLLILFFIVFRILVFFLGDIFRIHFIVIKNFFLSILFGESSGFSIGFPRKTVIQSIRAEKIRSSCIGAAANGTAFCRIRICGSANIADNFIHRITSSSNQY